MSARIDVDARARVRRLDLAILAVVSYVPFLLSSPGKVSGDTKAYLYLDPGRLLERAPYLWDSHVGAGTVTHQNIGFLFPMGPYYWVMEHLGVPDWVAQRLWLGSISFAAGLGVLWLLTILGARRAGAFVGALAYMLSPYQLAFTARISAILLPWAGLPWLVALTARAQVRRGWRDPAMFALVTLLIGGTNATSLLLAGIGPALWLVVAVAEGRSSLRDALATAGRIALPTVGVSLWWGAGLVNQGRYGIPILDVTETVKSVADSALPTEVLRGLGNWFFYGGDGAGQWLDQSSDYIDSRWLLALTFAVPAAALLGAAISRWRYRAFFGALVVLGAVIAIGAYPYDHPSPMGSLFKDFASGSAAGLALRNSPRAVPLVVLGLAGLLAAGVSALAVRIRLERAAALGVGLLVVVAFTPVWRTGYLSERIEAPGHVPAYWSEAAAVLDAQSHDTRILEIPGSLFAAYRWGNTVDPITPGLVDRPWIARELLASGGPGTVNLLAALDRRMQEGTLEPASLAPVARLLRAGTVVLRADLDTERYGTPSPAGLFDVLTEARGLAAPEAFGPPVEGQEPVRAVEVFDVRATPAIVASASRDRPVVLAGDGDGIVDAAAAGLLDGDEVILYAASLGGADLRQVRRARADLVVTDTNRRRARRWNTMHGEHGYTERPGQVPLADDVDDFRLEVVPGAGDDARTVTIQRGARVDATGYGTRGSYRPDDRPVLALDGDASTAWRVGGDGEPVGERLVVTLDEPVRIDHVRLVQAPTGTAERAISEATLRFDGGDPLRVHLDAASRTPDGQVVPIGSRRFQRLEIEVRATDSVSATNGVGFAEIGIGDVRASEVVRMPVALLRRMGTSSLEHRLVYMMTRDHHEEASLVRRLEVPTAREFTLSGMARVATNAAGAPGGQEGECRDDVVSIDGRPLAVRISGDQADARRAFAVEVCDGPVHLARGSHVLRAHDGRNSGFDVERILLSSGPGGTAEAPGTLGAPRSSSGARVRVTDADPIGYDLRIRTDGEPFWLVLGQSHNVGWSARVGSGTDLGEPVLVNGYANGWRVDPTGPGTMTVHLQWRGQRLVWLGLASSVLAALGCIALLALGRRRGVPALDDAPALTSPARWVGAVPSRSVSVMAALGCGLTAWAVSRPVIGAAVAAGVLAALTIPRARVALTVVGPVALVAGKALGTPELGWLAVTLLGADLVCGWIVERASSRRADPGSPAGSPVPARRPPDPRSHG